MKLISTQTLQLSLAAATLSLLTACATTVKPTYVSPTQYQSLNCAQISAEFGRIQQYLNDGVQPAKSNGVGVGVGLGGGVGFGGGRSGWGFGPSISVNMGQSSNTKKTEISRLYGQQDALTQAAQFKNCGFVPKRQVEQKK
jgi:hypothetical protein